MHCLLLYAATTLDLAYYEMLRDDKRRCAAQECIHRNTKWQTKVTQNTSLVRKVEKWTGINVSMQQKNSFRLSNPKKLHFDYISITQVNKVLIFILRNLSCQVLPLSHAFVKVDH